MQYLLFIHLIAGSISLIVAAFAVLSSNGKKLIVEYKLTKGDIRGKALKQLEL